jgi:Ca2+-binding EF-hand superfamily protein
MLDDQQSAAYDKLTKEHTALISEKMRKIEYQKNTSYNKEAVESFSKAFQLFKSDESTYKNQTQLYKLASQNLFAYDASRLFNETLIYYNHVYTYIFSKLDDDGKLHLTRFSIECEKRLGNNAE